MLTDSHAHLTSLDDPEGAIERAEENGVSRIISISSDLASAESTLALTEKHNNIFAAVGVHPHSAKVASQEIITEFEKLAKKPEVVAIGETGLDYYYMNSEKDVQIQSLIKHIDLARRTVLPLVIHVREADQDLKEILRSENISERTGVIHCFTGNYETAKSYLDLGFYISFSGIVTFKKSEEIRVATKKVPADKLLIETDSPYLAPVPHRGKKNEPAYVRYVAETIADVRGVSFDEIVEITSANAETLFQLNPRL